jgi:hypothetical protein
VSAERRGEGPFDPRLVSSGREIFRFDHFGNPTFWTDTLRMHEVIRGTVGPGVSPNTALAVGLRVDADALPESLKEALAAGAVDLDDPATTVALLELGAVLGVVGEVDETNTLTRVGITCALCHSTVDNGHRVEARRTGDARLHGLSLSRHVRGDVRWPHHASTILTDERVHGRPGDMAVVRPTAETEGAGNPGLVDRQVRNAHGEVEANLQDELTLRLEPLRHQRVFEARIQVNEHRCTLQQSKRDILLRGKERLHGAPHTTNPDPLSPMQCTLQG